MDDDGRSSCPGSVSPSPIPPFQPLWHMDTDLRLTDSFNGVTIGVCAMNKKTLSQPMQNILGRMVIHEFVRVVLFSDETILHRPVDEWLYCDALIAFFSKGFPLDKAIEYVEKKKPKMVLNDLEMQYSLMDRTKVYQILMDNDVDVPFHVVVRRNKNKFTATSNAISTTASTTTGTNVTTTGTNVTTAGTNVTTAGTNVTTTGTNVTTAGTNVTTTGTNVTTAGTNVPTAGTNVTTAGTNATTASTTSYVTSSDEISDGSGLYSSCFTSSSTNDDDDNEDENNEDDVILVDDDTLEIKGHTFHKPFVEKPLSGEDHNINIYFPSDYGGGRQVLFRKVDDRSSYYCKDNSVRRDGSYIYEEFLATDGTDVKVYTVGPDYAHAEARKSPALDGRVERVDNGKEKRYPVILTAEEKLIARKVCMAFKQTVCGFDLLRANGRSYVCDVNGFSFVKNTEKYYDDCSQILLEMILSKTAPHYIKNSVPLSEPPSLQTVPVPIAAVTASSMELRCVIGVIRHADRTPKQKMKMIVTHAYFFDLFDEWDGYSRGSVKIKKPKNLQTIMDIACKLLDQVEREGEEEAGLDEKIHKLQQLKSVLKMYDQFSGINRKIQLKLVHKGLDGEPLKRYPSLLLILKWGGEVTPSGEKHAEKLGKAFRCMYPGGEGEYSSLPGSGFLRLHSTYRHDLKVYASDEGRVQLTAAAFTKGLLALEGNLASILVHLVKRDQNATMMLDTSNESSEQLHKVKQTLHHCLKADNDFDHFSIQQLAPTRSPPLLEAMKYTHNPYKACSSLHQLIYSLLDHLQVMAENNPHLVLYHGETIQLMIKRWTKLWKDFSLKDKYDISKIPDIYDCIKYDLQHNKELDISVSHELYSKALYLADIVIPQEYGITVVEKYNIGKTICNRLLKKIRSDLRQVYSNADAHFLHRLDAKKSHGVISPNRSVRTRLYFTSESHVHALVNILKHGNIVNNEESLKVLENCPELNFLTQVVFMVYEDTSRSSRDRDRFTLDIHFSPGIKSRHYLLKDHIITTAPSSLLAEHTDTSTSKVKKQKKSSLTPSSFGTSKGLGYRRHTYANIYDTIIPHDYLSQNLISIDEDGTGKISFGGAMGSGGKWNATIVGEASSNAGGSSKHMAVRKNSREFYYQGGGLSELASVVEPLIHLSSAQLRRIDNYLYSICGNGDDNTDYSMQRKQSY